MNLLEILMSGGWVMIFIALTSVIGVGIFVERWMVLKKAGINYSSFMTRLTAHLENRNFKEAIYLCSKTDGPVAGVMEKGIRMMKNGKEAVKETLETAGRMEIYNLEKGLGVLGTIAGVAPLLGFLGTVTGMIRAFMKIEELGGNVNATVLAGGIWEALITTAAGLIVGIPAMIAYNYLVGKIKRFVMEIENSSRNLLDTVTIVGKGNDHEI